MMACTYDFDFLLCQPSLPPPDVVVDRSAFNDLPVEERLSITQRELEQMKQALRLKESEMEDSQHELKFHAIKNEELMDVINAFRSSSADRSHEIMRAKAEQNSELTLQVHTLRDLLTKSGDQIADLQKQLAQKSEVEEKLASHERTQKRLQVQLNGLVKTLDNVEIKSVDIPSEWINLQWITGGLNKKAEKEDSDKVIQDITQKIITMEADRQRLIKDSSLYKQGDGAKEAKILALEREIRKMKHDQDELNDTNKSLQKQLEVREGKIGALEELFQSINANRNIVAKKTGSIPNRLDSLLNIEDEDNEDDCESVDIDSVGGGENEQNGGLSFEEMFTNIWTSFTGTPTTPTKKIETASSSDEDQEISSCFSGSYHTKQVDEELQVAAKEDLDQLRESHRALTEEHGAAQFKISDLTAKLEEATIKANSFKTKAGLREKLLKDVIQQYKELQMENSDCKERMEQLKQKVAVLLQLEKDRHAERKAQEAAAAAAGDGKIVVKGPAVQESPTFEMSERTRMTTLEDSAEDPSIDNGIDKNFVMEDYKRLQGECDQIQHEFDSAIERINDLEESLKEAKDEVMKYQSLHADQARVIVLLEGEKAALQDRAIESTTKIVGTESENNQVEDELKVAELRFQKAREKQVQREKDLWDVIEQYKQLVDKNKSNNEEKLDAAQEMNLTDKLQSQRRDLVYEYHKLEKAMEESVETAEALAKELQQAKSEAAVNKEEARGIRKRLAGCHFHYKELQEHYDQLLKQNEEYEQELAKAEKYEGLCTAKEESWALMIDSMKEKYRIAEEKAENLSKENEQLQQLCEKLQGEMTVVPAEA